MTDHHVLSTWKEIACFLGVSVNTAIRYHQEEGMPVTRIGQKGCRVYATDNMIAKWLESRGNIVGANCASIGS
jgi:hypothetical protein